MVPGREDAEPSARVFAALVLEPTLAERVSARVDEALGDGAGFRRPRPEGLHLTLHFLGDVPRARLPALAQALEALRGAPAPELVLTGTGGFPDDQRPRVLWIGVREAGGTAGRLERLADEAGKALGGPRIPGPFRAHVTVARARDPAAGVPDAFRDLVLDGPWRPAAVDLLESVRAAGPARYVSCARWPLALK